MGTDARLIRPRSEVCDALLDLLLSRGAPVTAKEAYSVLAAELNLSASEVAEPRRKSRKPTKWANEVQWAFQDLKRKGLAEALQPGLWQAARSSE